MSVECSSFLLVISMHFCSLSDHSCQCCFAFHTRFVIKLYKVFIYSKLGSTFRNGLTIVSHKNINLGNNSAQNYPRTVGFVTICKSSIFDLFHQIFAALRNFHVLFLSNGERAEILHEGLTRPEIQSWKILLNSA